MLRYLGYTNVDLALAAQMKSAETPGALCDNVIDAINWVAGHPLAGAMEAASNCAVEIIPVSDPAITKLVADNSYFVESQIPGEMYNGTPNDVPTFGVGAIFVTSADAPDAMIYTFTKAVFENFDAFKGLHPALANLTKEGMIESALSSPLHPGAIRYYKEVGLMK